MSIISTYLNMLCYGYSIHPYTKITIHQMCLQIPRKMPHMSLCHFAFLTCFPSVWSVYYGKKRPFLVRLNIPKREFVWWILNSFAFWIYGIQKFRWNKTGENQTWEALEFYYEINVFAYIKYLLNVVWICSIRHGKSCFS